MGDISKSDGKTVDQVDSIWTSEEDIIRDILRALHAILEPGQVTELRALNVINRKTGYLTPISSGYYDDLEKLAKKACDLTSNATGVYIVPNLMKPELLARAANRQRDRLRKDEQTTADSNILQRRWLLIDADSKHASGISASEKEHGLAVARAWQIKEALLELGWPDPIFADSGNGGHLMYRIDLPVNDNGLVQRILEALAGRFDDDVVTIDKTVFNPSRIWKLYGTWARKGDNLPDRPHRQSQILELPQELLPVDLELLEALANTARQNGTHIPQRRHNAGSSLDLESWIRQHQLDVKEPKPWNGGRLWEIKVCPWNSEHARGEAYVAQYPHGAIVAGCKHNSCSGHTWRELRQIYEPDCYKDKRKTVNRPNKETLLQDALDLYSVSGCAAWAVWESLLGNLKTHGYSRNDAVELTGQLMQKDCNIGDYVEEQATINKFFPSPKAEQAAGAVADSGDRKPRMSQATMLLNFARDHIKDLFITLEGTSFVSIPRNDVVQTIPVQSTDFRHYLRWLYSSHTEAAINAEAIKNAIDHIDSQAAMTGKTRRVYSRVAPGDGAVYLDLANDGWDVVVITAAGWEITNNASVTFRRGSGMLPLPFPVHGGSLDLLRKFVNLSDEDWVLFVAYLVGALQPNGPHPMLVMNGEQGSAKSTTTRLVKALIDPSIAPLRTPPRDAESVLLTATHNWIVAYDNLSHLPQWLSDSFASLLTGVAQGKRKLYTDSDESLLVAKRPLILNGIPDFVDRSDLIDRAIFLTLKPIPEDERQSEERFWSSFEAVLPEVFGALLDAVSKALQRRNEIRLEKLPRMADFALWVMAAEPALPWDRSKLSFIDIYKKNRKASGTLALEGNPVAEAIFNLMKLQEKPWEGMVTDLYAAIKPERPPKKFPETPRGLSQTLKRIAPNLRSEGIDIVLDDRTAKGRRVTIRECVANDVANDVANPGNSVANDVANGDAASSDVANVAKSADISVLDDFNKDPFEEKTDIRRPDTEKAAFGATFATLPFGSEDDNNDDAEVF